MGNLIQEMPHRPVYLHGNAQVFHALKAQTLCPKMRFVCMSLPKCNPCTHTYTEVLLGHSGCVPTDVNETAFAGMHGKPVHPHVGKHFPTWA